MLINSLFLNSVWITGGYGSGGEMIVQEDTVFVSGMDQDLTEEDIAQHFGAIGVIKVGSFNIFIAKKANIVWIFNIILWNLGIYLTTFS